MMPSVSIIIPTFNRSQRICKTLDSLLKQTYSDFEIIIISNGSMDDTEFVVKSYQDPRILFYNQAPSGSPASPRNNGITKARGRYIAFCDDDDLWVESKLSKQIEFLENNPEFALCGSGMRRFSEQSEWINQDELKFGEITSKDLLFKNTIPLSSILIRSDIIKKFHGFDESESIAGAEDYELTLRISKSARMFCLPEYLMLYYSGDQRFTNAASSNLIRRNYKYIIRLFSVYCSVIKKGFYTSFEVVVPFVRNLIHYIKIILFHFKESCFQCFR